MKLLETNEGFLWLPVDRYMAFFLFGEIELFQIDKDGSNTLIENANEIKFAFDNGFRVCVSCGHFLNIEKLY